MEPGESQASSRDLCMLSMCTRGAPPCEVSRGCPLCVEYFAHQGNQLSRNRSYVAGAGIEPLEFRKQGSYEARLRMRLFKTPNPTIFLFYNYQRITQYPRPRHRNSPNMNHAILILTTGGTIDKQYFDALSRYQITDTIVTKLLTIARVTHPFLIEEILRKDSIDLTHEDRSRILHHVPNKTIVLTGALTPARFSESDAAFNLGMAFATAQTGPPGVYITINGTVFPADQVVKDRERGCFVFN